MPKSVCLSLTFVALCAATPFAADELAERVVLQGGLAHEPVTPHVIEIDLRDVPQVEGWKPGDPLVEIPRRRYYDATVADPPAPDFVDPLVERQQRYFNVQRGLSGFSTPTRNFVGIPNTGAGVPDTTGDVGFNHIIQATNAGGTRVRIWDKATPVPNVLTTFQLETALGTGICGTNGLGDPIVIFDRNADRWVLMEFVSGGNNLCVYVSRTGDPVTGGWNTYDFVAPSFPDYPKLGVWPTDANGGGGSYVVTANAGSAVYAMERGPMLDGNAAQFQTFNLPGLPGFGFEAATPADIDGPVLPPATAPAVIMRHRDTEVHNGPAAPEDLLEMWELDVDWQTIANTSLSQTPSIDVAEFSSELCGLVSFSCIDQPNSGTNLDPLREVIMYRLQYINFEGDGYEVLVGNFVVDVSGTEQGGIRWFELRRTGGASQPWTLHQEGTYSIDSDSRWMGASAMDQSGNIALAYNVSSATTFPGLRYTGRKASDPLGVMTAPETSLIEGTSPSGTNRYGDYAQMGLDPSDDCTFWFTGEYNVSTQWSVRWASFAFDSCGCLLEPTPPSLVTAVTADNAIDLTWSDADLDTVIEYDVRRSRNQGGPYETIATIEDNSPGSVGGPDYFFTDPDVSADIEYFYVVVASDGAACSSDLTNEVSNVTGGFCTLDPVFSGVTSAEISLDDTCGAVVTWDGATAECGGPLFYNLYRSTDPGFVPGPANLVASGLQGNSVIDENGLVSQTEYFYAVRAVDSGNLIEDGNDAKASVVVGGSGGDQTVYFEDFESASSFNDWTVSTGPGSHNCGEFERSSSNGERPNGGSGSYARALSFECRPLLPLTSTFIDSPTIDLDVPGIGFVQLELDLWYNHNGGETGTIEVWNGSQWVVVWTDPNSDFNGPLSIDVTAEATGVSDFQVRFNYQTANNDRWYSFDNVRIGVDLVCNTQAQPSPAPDGSGGTSALSSDRLDVAGSQLQVDWDAASCSATEWNLIYGSLAGVSSYAIDGSQCVIGNGSFNWNSVPAGDLWYLVVGADGSGIESSWGDATVGERNGVTPSGECGSTAKNVVATCPN